MGSIDEMLLFGKLVELKSFGSAADSLRMSRFLVSKKINHLEDRLGVQLIHRTTRRLDLTEAGRAFY
jgi:DNA-binding transcriptional LysR family regulator